MPARVPQDVDLEDRLVFNLTAVQFGYVVIGALGAAIVWKVHWGPPPLRLPAAIPPLLLGAALAWGRWRGRALDAWAADALLFLRHNLRLSWTPSLLPGALRRARMRRHTRAPRTWTRRRPPRPRPPALPAHHE